MDQDTLRRTVITIQPRRIPGRWRDGYALDLHTTSSTYLGDDEFGHPRFETLRSEAGELLYKLKFAQDQTVVPTLVESLEGFIRSWGVIFDIIVPIPPSSHRRVQPVTVLAEALGQRLGIPILRCIRTTRDTLQLKNVADFDERLRLLKGLYEVDAAEVRAKKILLFDDLYRSGATINAVTEVLYDQGGASEVLALTVTRTRSNR